MCFNQQDKLLIRKGNIVQFFNISLGSTCYFLMIAAFLFLLFIDFFKEYKDDEKKASLRGY